MAEFVTEILPIPLIDQLLLPVVFLLDRKIWWYAQVKDLFELVVRYPQFLVNISSGIGPVARAGQYCIDKAFEKSPSSGFTPQPIIDIMLTGLQTPLGITIWLFGSLGLSILIAWVAGYFWGGWVNHRLRGLYGWKFAKAKEFALWEKTYNSRQGKVARWAWKRKYKLMIGGYGLGLLILTLQGVLIGHSPIPSKPIQFPDLIAEIRRLLLAPKSIESICPSS